MFYKMNSQHLQSYWRVTKITLLAFLLGVIVAFISFLPFGLTLKVWLNPKALFISNLSMYVVVFLFLKRNLKSLFPFNFENFNWKILGKLFLIYVPLLILLGALSNLVNIPGYTEKIIEKISPENLLVFFLNFVILAPIMEELIFRGILLSYLMKQIPTQQAILFSSLLFGLIHGNLDQMVFAALGGIFLAYACLKSNSLAVPIFFHALNNLLTFLAIIWE